MQRLFCADCGMVVNNSSHRCQPGKPEEGEDFSWAAWRAGGIGSSEAPGVMETSPYLSRRKVWELKTGRALPNLPSVPMLQGIEAEPFIRAWYERQIGIEMPKDLDIHPEYNFIRASFDGINWKKGRLAEFKFCGKDDHRLALEGKIPRKYQYQLVQQMIVVGTDVIDYVSYYSPNRNNPRIGSGKIIPFRLVKKEADALIRENTKLWGCVLRDVPPDAGKPAQLFKVKKA